MQMLLTGPWADAILANVAVAVAALGDVTAAAAASSMSSPDS